MYVSLSVDHTTVSPGQCLDGVILDIKALRNALHLLGCEASTAVVGVQAVMMNIQREVNELRTLIESRNQQIEQLQAVNADLEVQLAAKRKFDFA